MNLGEFEESKNNINELDKLLPLDQNVAKLRKDMEELKEKSQKSKKNFLKKGLFGNSHLYYDKEVKAQPVNILPELDNNNKFIYLDMVVDNNYKNPYKVKFELFSKDGLNIVTDWIYNKFKEEKMEIKDSEISFIEGGDEGDKTDQSYFVLRKMELEGNDVVVNSEILEKFYNNYPLVEECLLVIHNKEYLAVNLLKDEGVKESNKNLAVLGRCSYNKKFFDHVRQLKLKTNEASKTLNVKITNYGISLNL